jgi:hypothetical protein
MMKESFKSAAICRATAMGMPMIIILGGSQEFPVGSVGPIYAESFGAFSAMPAGKVIIMEQVAPAGIIVLKNGSEKDN